MKILLKAEPSSDENFELKNQNSKILFQGSQNKLEYAYLYQNQVADVNENVLDAAPALIALDIGDNQLEDHKLGFIPKGLWFKISTNHLIRTIGVI